MPPLQAVWEVVDSDARGYDRDNSSSTEFSCLPGAVSALGGALSTSSLEWTFLWSAP
jgi:hypothetical protein